MTTFPCFNQCAKLKVNLHIYYDKVKMSELITPCIFFPKEIHMADNQLIEITDNQLEPLLSLVSLNVRGNKIQILPEQVALLPNLERLDVTNNDLAEYRIYLINFFCSSF